MAGAGGLGTTITDLLPTEAPPDTLALLKEQAKRLFEGLLQTADRETFVMLNPLLAKLAESPASPEGQAGASLGSRHTRSGSSIDLTW